MVSDLKGRTIYKHGYLSLDFNDLMPICKVVGISALLRYDRYPNQLKYFSCCYSKSRFGGFGSYQNIEVDFSLNNFMYGGRFIFPYDFNQ